MHSAMKQAQAICIMAIQSQEVEYTALSIDFLEVAMDEGRDRAEREMAIERCTRQREKAQACRAMILAIRSMAEFWEPTPEPRFRLPNE